MPVAVVCFCSLSQTKKNHWLSYALISRKEMRWICCSSIAVGFMEYFFCLGDNSFDWRWLRITCTFWQSPIVWKEKQTMAHFQCIRIFSGMFLSKNIHVANWQCDINDPIHFNSLHLLFLPYASHTIQPLIFFAKSFVFLAILWQMISSNERPNKRTGLPIFLVEEIGTISFWQCIIILQNQMSPSEF